VVVGVDARRKVGVVVFRLRSLAEGPSGLRFLSAKDGEGGVRLLVLEVSVLSISNVPYEGGTVVAERVDGIGPGDSKSGAADNSVLKAFSEMRSIDASSILYPSTSSIFFACSALSGAPSAVRTRTDLSKIPPDGKSFEDI
tara:strand:- start:202 stop:624 length:423 start_codon:yes stop_codon:yes gene_type:complete